MRRLPAVVAGAAVVVAGLGGITPATASAHPAGFPDAASTGTGRAGQLRFAAGPIHLNRAGQTLENVVTNHTITVNAPHVHIRHVRIVVSGGAFGIMLGRRASHTELGWDTIRGRSKSSSGAGIEAVKDIYGTGNKVWAHNLNIFDFGDGIQTYSGTIENCFIHGLADVNGYHLEDINENGNSGRRLWIRHNTLLNSAGQTASVYIGADFTYSANVTVRHNWMAGGGYTLYGGGRGVGLGANPSNIRVINNVFERRYFRRGRRYGPVAYFDSGHGDVWRGNHWRHGGRVRP